MARSFSHASDACPVVYHGATRRVCETIILVSRNKGVTTMIAFAIYFLQYAGAATRVGEAARNHRVPSSADLKILDLPASAFAR